MQDISELDVSMYYYIVIFALSFIISFLLVPGKMYFFKFWCFFAIGGFFSLIIRNAINKFKDISLSMAGKIVIFSLLFAVAVFGLIPNMVLEERQAELVKTIKLTAVRIKTIEATDYLTIQKSHYISSIQSLLKNAKIDYPSHELGIVSFFIIFDSEDFQLTFEADIPSRHKKDVRISFNNWFGESYILIPGLGNLLVENGIINT